MRPEISEFSYGYAVTEAFARGFGPNLTGAPAFASLSAEGQPGGGYDVRLDRTGLPLFIQFKLAHCMVRTNALEARMGLLAAPFYRMHVRPRRHSDQHQLLLELENAGNEVYYVAPRFHRLLEFNEAYLSRTVLQNSVFVPPSVIGPLPDERNHHVAFRDGMAYVLSEPRRVEKPLDLNSLVRRLHAMLRDYGDRVSTLSLIQRLNDNMIHLLQERRREWPGVDFDRIREMADVGELASYLARTFFGGEVLIVAEAKA